MASRILHQALLALALLAAGCASPGDDAAATADDLAPTPADHGPEVPAAPEPEPATATCEMTRTNIGTSTGYGLNIDRLMFTLPECSLEGLFGGDIGWAQAAVIEATWTAQATQVGTEMWIEYDACQPSVPQTPCPIPEATGATSPLRMELSAEQLRTLEGQHPLVMVSGDGLVVMQAYTMHITMFPGAIPAGFTAVP